VVALCRARDIGTAASVADPARPPAILRGCDPADWPRLAADGRQAVADLVASVTPMVYALSRHELNREDLRGEMFVHLMRVAHTYGPTRTNAVRWPTYAWETLQHLHGGASTMPASLDSESHNPCGWSASTGPTP